MQMIGRYEILSQIGSGAMGDVYKGRDPALDRIAAIKVIRGVVTSETAVKRFQREAQAAARLSHPNIVTVYELGEHEGSPFIAMEYLDGDDLDELLEKDADIPIAKQIEIVIQAAEGLHFAHSKGVIHRDVKPANIAILRDGTVKIMDFGIAKLGDAKVTQTGLIMGTVRYMPPEQVQGKTLDGRADLFSLGVTFYEMVTKTKAFGGESLTSVIYNVMHAEPEPIHDLDGTPFEWLQPVILRCLEKDRENRWPDCKALADVLRSGGAPQAAVVSPDGSGASRKLAKSKDGSGGHIPARTVAVNRPGKSGPSRASNPPRRGSRVLLYAAIAVLLVAAGLVGIWLNSSTDRGKLIAQADSALAESRFPDAKGLLLEAQDAKGTEAELQIVRVKFGDLMEPMRAGGDLLGAKAVLDQVVAWNGASPQARASYRKLAKDLAAQGLPEGRPPHVAALEQASDAYAAGIGDKYDSATDYELMAACFDLAQGIMTRAEGSALPPRVRESLYDVARKLFLFVDEREPGFNAFERANTARSQRAKLSAIAHDLDAFKTEVDRLIAEAETLERDPSTHLQAIGNYRAVLNRVAESSELGEYVDLNSYRVLADAAIPRLEEKLREARQQMGRQKQTTLLTEEAAGLEKRGDLKGALARYEELLAVEPANASAQARRTELQGMLTRLDTLKTATETALSKKDAATARARLDEARNLVPADAALATLGAKVQRLEASSLEATEGAALLTQAAELRSQGKHEEAERKYREISASTKDDGVRRTADEAVRAIRLDRQAAEIQPLEEKARSLERSGDIDGALKTWRQVARLNSAWPGVNEQVKRLTPLATKSESAQSKDAVATTPAMKTPSPAEQAKAQDDARAMEKRKAAEAAPAQTESAAAPASQPARTETATASATAPEPSKADAAAPSTTTITQQAERLLQAYAAAVEAEDIDALKRTWPGLSGRQLKAVLDGFSFAKSHRVTLKINSVNATGDTAVAVCDRQDRLEAQDGKVIDNKSVATFHLRSSGQGWVIEDIR